MPASEVILYEGCGQDTLPVSAVRGGGPLGVTGVVIAVVMAAPITADKGRSARLRAGSARGMACRQSHSTV